MVPSQILRSAINGGTRVPTHELKKPLPRNKRTLRFVRIRWLTEGASHRSCHRCLVRDGLGDVRGDYRPPSQRTLAAEYLTDSGGSVASPDRKAPRVPIRPEGNSRHPLSSDASRPSRQSQTICSSRLAIQKTAPGL